MCERIVFSCEFALLRKRLLWSIAVNEKDALADEIQKKTYVASKQRESGIDAQRINSQLSELKSQLSQADKELADLDRELNADEQLYSQEKMSVSLSHVYRLVYIAV